MSLGGLTIPSSSLAEFVSNGTAILDPADEKITAVDSVSARTAAEYVLRKYSQPVRFTCEAHVEWGMKYSQPVRFTCEAHVEWGMKYSQPVRFTGEAH